MTGKYTQLDQSTWKRDLFSPGEFVVADGGCEGDGRFLCS